jgi:hypothetical protein
MKELRPIGTIFTLKGSSYNQDSNYGEHAKIKFNDEIHVLKFMVVDHDVDMLGRPVEIAKEIQPGECSLCGGYHGCTSECQRND